MKQTLDRIKNFLNSAVEPTPVEPTLNPERIVIFGSGTSGGPRLAHLLDINMWAIQEYVGGQGRGAPEIMATRNAGRIEDLFYGRTPENPTAIPTYPRGVFALADMVQYDDTGRTHRIETPVDFIQELCDRHDVPLVRMEEPVTVESFAQGIGVAVSQIEVDTPDYIYRTNPLPQVD